MKAEKELFKWPLDVVQYLRQDIVLDLVERWIYSHILRIEE